MAQARRRRLNGWEVTLVVIVAVLVVTFLVMLVQRFAPDGSADAGQTPTGEAAGEAPGEEQETEPADEAGEDLSGLDYSFVTPSGNIACAMAPDRVVCAIASFEYSVPGDLAETCTGNAGHFLAVTAETSRLLCDTSGAEPSIDPGDAPTLAYGDAVERGAFRCLSEETGVTCEHTGSGRSIAVARAAYSLG